MLLEPSTADQVAWTQLRFLSHSSGSWHQNMVGFCWEPSSRLQMDSRTLWSSIYQGTNPNHWDYTFKTHYISKNLPSNTIAFRVGISAHKIWVGPHKWVPNKHRITNPLWSKAPSKTHSTLSLVEEVQLVCLQLSLRNVPQLLSSVFSANPAVHLRLTSSFHPSPNQPPKTVEIKSC